MLLIISHILRLLFRPASENRKQLSNGFQGEAHVIV